MSRFRYAQKFLIISILFITPIALSLYFFVGGVNKEIADVRAEQNGITYLIPVQLLLRDMQQHRGLTGVYLSGSAGFKEALIEKRNEIDQVFIEIERIDTEKGIHLKGGAEPARIKDMKSEWNDIKQQFDRGTLTPESSFRVHTSLMHDIMFFIGQVGDNSNLTLDRDISTSYLIDALINRIPIITESMGQLRVSGLMLPEQKPISRGEKQIFLSLSNTADSNIRKLNTRMEDVFVGDKGLREELSPSLKNANGGVEALLSIVDRKIMQADLNTLLREEYYATSTQAIDKVFGFYDTAGPVLNTLLQDRINLLKIKRSILFVSIGASLVFVAYLLIGFYLGVKETIDALHTSTSNMLKNNQDGKIVLDTHDEFSEIANSFNIIINAFTVANDNLRNTIAKKEAAEQQFKKQAEKIAGFNQLMVGRELKMVELKEEIAALKKQLEEHKG